MFIKSTVICRCCFLKLLKVSFYRGGFGKLYILHEWHLGFVLLFMVLQTVVQFDFSVSEQSKF